MIRYLYVIMDMSKAMGDNAWKPNRLRVVSDVVQVRTLCIVCVCVFLCGCIYRDNKENVYIGIYSKLL